MAKVSKVTLLLAKIVADRNQYKPYISELASPLEHPVYVQIEVPEDSIIRDDEEVTIITADGLAAVLGKVAGAIDNMHEEYKRKFLTPSKNTSGIKY